MDWPLVLTFPRINPKRGIRSLLGRSTTNIQCKRKLLVGISHNLVSSCAWIFACFGSWLLLLIIQLINPQIFKLVILKKDPLCHTNFTAFSKYDFLHLVHIARSCSIHFHVYIFKLRIMYFCFYITRIYCVLFYKLLFFKWQYILEIFLW